MNKPITLVLGATGRTGGAVVRELLADPGPEGLLVRAAGRRRDALDALARLGAQTVPLDLDGIERAPLAAHRALHDALAGVDRLFLLTGYSVEMLVHSKAVVDAAKLAGVRHIVHMGAAGPPDATLAHVVWHQLVEAYISASGLGHTQLHPNVFMQNILAFGLARRVRRLRAADGATADELARSRGGAPRRVPRRDRRWPMKLDGKVALVTGASRGIGAAIAERLGRDGAAVAVSYSRSEREAFAVAGGITDRGGKAVVLRADLGAPDAARKLVDDTVRHLGRLDILVNNAVSLAFGAIEEIGDATIREQLATNVEAPLVAMRAAAPHLPTGGRVINISSLITIRPLPGSTLYAAAKGALEAMTRVWALELGPRGITVNAVAPGPVETDAFRANADEDMRARFIERTPLGRIGQPDDVADIVAFLASHDARWVTGHVLLAGGGFLP